MINRIKDYRGRVVADNVLSLMKLRGKVEGAELIMRYPAHRLVMFTGCEIRLSKKDTGHMVVTVTWGVVSKSHVRVVSERALEELRKLWRSPRGGWSRGGETEQTVTIVKGGVWSVRGE